MRPKSRTELRVIISQLYDYLKAHDDLLDYESAAVNKALQLLVVADCHLAHLGISHRVAKSFGEMRERVLYVVCNLPGGSYKFIELPYGCEVVGIYSEAHLKKCYQALVDNGLCSDFQMDS